MSSLANPLRRFVASALAERANPEHAGPMQAYMKTDMPFLGVKKPDRISIEREMKRRFAPADRQEWEEGVLALWSLPHREGKYLAIEYAKAYRAHAVPASLPLFERLIREGAWWDLVDDVAAHLVGRVWSTARDWTGPRMDAWIDDPDLWIRRTAIIGQLKHKADTDSERLFRYCRARMHEREFFMRKAIGWALRQYGYSAPGPVREFLLTHRAELSGLSFREGARVLIKQGLMEP